MSAVLVVDDDPVVRVAVQNILSALGHRVVLAEDVRSALLLLDGTEHYDQVVLDHDLPDGTGVEVAAALARLQPTACVVMHTSRTLAERPHGVDVVVAKSPGLGPLLDALLPRPTQPEPDSRT